MIPPAAAAGDTIFALSSGALPAAIAVVRVSGPAAAAVLETLARRLPPPRVATLAELREGDGGLLDRALLLWFPGPASATGEDLAELHLHGGRAVTAAVLEAIGRVGGCRPAVPGEFTRRAFIHGRIDLIEAEGLADLLAAETEGERRRALDAAEGGVSRRIAGWREQTLTLAARIEAQIEFAEDEGDVGTDLTITTDLAMLARELRATLAAPPAERLRDGIRIVLAGPPNAGKSSLINAIAERDVAITAPAAGTTRDVIEAPLRLAGHSCVLIDTAGLRDADEAIEQIGVARARAAIDRADLLLWLGPPDECPAPERSLVIHPRADLPGRETCPEGADLAVSVVTGLGIERLTLLISERIAALVPAPDQISLPLRQRALLSSVASDLEAAAALDDPLLLAEHLRSALVAFDRLTGRAGVEDMLDALFGSFCIGK